MLGLLIFTEYNALVCSTVFRCSLIFKLGLSTTTVRSEVVVKPDKLTRHAASELVVEMNVWIHCYMDGSITCSLRGEVRYIEMSVVRKGVTQHAAQGCSRQQQPMGSLDCAISQQSCMRFRCSSATSEVYMVAGQHSPRLRSDSSRAWGRRHPFQSMFQHRLVVSGWYVGGNE